MRPVLEWLEDRLALATWTVDLAGDAGVADPNDPTKMSGDFRYCLNQANAANNGGEIAFSIPGQPTINITAALPAITDNGLYIDGLTQAWPNSVGNPQVELNGGGVNADGLTVNAAGVTIFGLAIDNFKGNGIVLNNPAGMPGDWVYGNYIGTDLSGVRAGVGNLLGGIFIQGSGNTVGGTMAPQEMNVISGNGSDGVDIAGATATQNVIEGNRIGVDGGPGMALPNAGDGVLIEHRTSNNTVGGYGVSNNSLGNSGNVIAGNGRNGVEISDLASGNYVIGNNIGIAANGTTVVGNTSNGVSVTLSAKTNIIGSSQQGGANLVAGNGGDGVFDGSPAVNGDFNADTIIGNFIGVLRDGSTVAANKGNGVEINCVAGDGVSNNVISGNYGDGVDILGDTAGGAVISIQVDVWGNMIGVNQAGNATAANGEDGVDIYLANNNTIGGATQETEQNPYVSSNVISGNKYFGVEIAGSNNLVVNNFIGTDVSGTNALGNLWGGVWVGWCRQSPHVTPATVTAANNTIGGTGGANLTQNVISGNDTGAQQGGYGNGISLYGTGVQGTLIQGNMIGTNVTGMVFLGNANDGIAMGYTISAFGNDPTNTTIGGTVAAAGNVISCNGVVPARGGGYGVDEAGMGLIQNNIIGYDVNRGNLNMMKNQKGATNGNTLWTDQNNLEQP